MSHVLFNLCSFILFFTVKVIFKFLKQPDFQELHRYELKDEDWEALKVFLDILSVCHIFTVSQAMAKNLSLDSP